MEIYGVTNYRRFLYELIQKKPKRGYGQAKKLAESLNVSTTLISQILSEEKHLTPEQALGVTQFFGFNENESSYFTTLVNYERAGTPELKKWLKRTLNQIRIESQKVVAQISYQKALTDEERGIFYSDWTYSATRMLTSIPKFNSVDTIAEHLGVPKVKIAQVLHFLVSAGLVIEDNGYRIGPQSTHLSSESPWARLHHSNWRAKAIEQFDFPGEEKLHYTSPMTLSQKDAALVRTKLLGVIGEINKIVDPSPSEEFMCLNVDWFKIS